MLDNPIKSLFFESQTAANAAEVSHVGMGRHANLVAAYHNMQNVYIGVYHAVVNTVEAVETVAEELTPPIGANNPMFAEQARQVIAEAERITEQSSQELIDV